ncbi:Purine catabolism regulatory protein-like family protein [Corynebacterium occultum]|uniref:Purine catabolism regulatory protein-like family protein n=1 Tax=Corynebacterium occultum TaxID=2675219 RepID=A0A6B8VU13_9CORY|nr:PucR family transcriptional regulator [Corynebacterium occultum]QGU06589.1 Purine catabolism regulatory protein-like family protein [Corynebacterium occultum]
MPLNTPAGPHPDPGIQAVLKLGDVLALPELLDAGAELLVGHHQLGRSIRWAHVADSRRVGQLLRGGELLLSTGSGWGATPAERAEQVASFAAAGAAALLVELGLTWTEIPEEVVAQCRKHELPLLVAHRELRFVAVTEAVHLKILERQVEEITMMNSVVETMSALLYNGAPTEQIITQAGRLLQAPVVLEDPSHAVVCYAEGHHLPSKLLAGWREKSATWAREGQAPVNPRQVVDLVAQVPWTFIDIRARGTSLGRLFYRGGVDNERIAHHILRHTAMTLAVQRLSSRNPNSWVELIERNAVQRLVGTRFNTVEDAEEVLEVSGFRARGRVLIGCELFHDSAALDSHQLRELLRPSLGKVDVLLSPTPGQSRRLTAALSLPTGMNVHQVVRQLGEVLLKTYGSAVVVVVSEPCDGAVELAISLRELRELGEVSYGPGPLRMVALAETPMAGLLNQLRDDVRVQGFVSLMLDPLLLHDAAHGTDLLETLRMVLEHPASRSAAAQKLHLSRTALYARISKIETLLEVDLGEGDTQFALGLAVRAHRRER